MAITTLTGVTVANAIFSLFLVVLFAGTAGCQLLGYHVGKAWRAHGHDPAAQGTSALEGSLFALLSLLIAFIIAGGQTRLDARHQMLAEEANAIETAYLRLNLLPAAAQPALRDQFRRYTDARIAYFAHIQQRDVARAAESRATALAREIWQDATAATLDKQANAAAVISPQAINRMIDLSTMQEALAYTHTPIAVFALLIQLAFMCAFFAGVGTSKGERPRMLHVVAFAGTVALTCYVIVNMEYPRLGLVRFGRFDAFLAAVRQRMG